MVYDTLYNPSPPTWPACKLPTSRQYIQNFDIFVFIFSFFCNFF